MSSQTKYNKVNKRKKVVASNANFYVACNVGQKFNVCSPATSFNALIVSVCLKIKSDG